MASSSSMKIMDGAFSLASEKASRTSLAPSPMNICTNCGPASLRNVDLVWAAQALARSVLPVPGGPYSNTPSNNTNLEQRPVTTVDRATFLAARRNITKGLATVCNIIGRRNILFLFLHQIKTKCTFNNMHPIDLYCNNSQKIHQDLCLTIKTTERQT